MADDLTKIDKSNRVRAGLQKHEVEHLRKKYQITGKAAASAIARAPNPTDRYVGSRLRMRRHMFDMSQEQLANAIGLTFQQVQKYEKGVNRISASRLQQFAAVLKVPVAFFFEGAPDAPGQTSQNASTPDYVSEFVSSADGLALIKAFRRIKDAVLRHRLVRLVEQITADE